MKLKPILTELNSEIKKELEIIYKDRDVVVIMPKSQMTSRMYGKNTEWCQVSKTGFDMWSKVGLLIRFLLRGGRKIRFTYFFDDMAFGGHPKGSYYWASENGHHVLKGNNDPFEPQPKDPNRIRDIEKDIIEQIGRIPEEAKEKVREFIKIYKEGYDYCYKDNEFKTKKEILLKSHYKILNNILNTYEEGIIEVFGYSPRIYIGFYYEHGKYSLSFQNLLTTNYPEDGVEHFVHFDDAKTYLLQMCKIFYNEHAKVWQPKDDFK